ncbi:MAG: carboxypeptidase-like regulatory domain-containing protein [Acidobacteriota bacterium]|nr:carboxypeptidase-like regulatory domain-containing protein [Acidobacteriota bacterium]
MHSFRKMALIAMLLAVSPLYGQTGTSTIRGTITDPGGRLVSGANVTITNVETNGKRTATSTDAGTYVFDLITPAEYRLEVEAKGFKTNVVDHVQALIGKPTEASVQLQVGTTSETVEVNATAQEVLINTQDATLGNNFIAQQITASPGSAQCG